MEDIESKKVAKLMIKGAMKKARYMRKEEAKSKTVTKITRVRRRSFKRKPNVTPVAEEKTELEMK